MFVAILVAFVAILVVFVAILARFVAISLSLSTISAAFVAIAAVFVAIAAVFVISLLERVCTFELKASISVLKVDIVLAKVVFSKPIMRSLNSKVLEAVGV